MPLLTPKYELLVDLNKPVEESIGCVLLIANSQPGKQLELLREVELKLGEQIQAIENQLKVPLEDTIVRTASEVTLASNE